MYEKEQFRRLTELGHVLGRFVKDGGQSERLGGRNNEADMAGTLAGVGATFADLKWWVTLLCCVGLVTSVAAVPPVILARDIKIAADLTGSPLLEKQSMQDCQLRLEGKPGQYRLAYSGGTIPVPTKAVNTIQDGDSHVVVKGKLGGLSLRMLSIPYFAKPLTEAKVLGLDGIYRFGAPETYYQIVFSGHESVVEPQLRKLWPEGVILNHRNLPNLKHGVLQYLADKDIADLIDDEYVGILPLQSPKTTTTVDYACILYRNAN